MPSPNPVGFADAGKEPSTGSTENSNSSDSFYKQRGPTVKITD